MRKSKRAISTLLITAAAVLTGVLALTATGRGDPAGFTRAQVLRGRYLVTAAAGCGHCHGGASPADPQWLAGRTQPFEIMDYKVYASNLTPDAATGIGKWTPQQLFDSLRLGKDPAGGYLAPPMPWPGYRDLTDQDLWAIVAYLRSVKPVSNHLPDSAGPPGGPAGEPDWSGAYKDLQPLPPYPAANEVEVK
jgi:mono/diheme cytochrome c family protein